MKRVMGYYPGITAARIGCALLRDSDERIQNAQGRTESPVRSHARPEGQAGFEHPSRKLAARAGGAAARGRKSLLVFGPGSSSGPPLFFCGREPRRGGLFPMFTRASVSARAL